MASQKVFKSYKQTVELITPSSLSAIFCVVGSLVISLGVIFINRYRPGRLGLNNLTNKLHQTLRGNYLMGSLTSNAWVKRLPMISLYLLILLLIYLIAIDFKKSAKVKRNILSHTAVRVVILAIWLPYLLYFFNDILAYVAKIDIVSTTASNIYAVIGYILLAILISSAAIHLHVIFLRAISLKSRLINL